VRGRVQGVGFRATTFDEARRLNLAGWARNRIDGTVEVLAEGPEPQLKLFLDYLHHGPRGALVTGVVEDWSEEQGAPVPFQIKRTE
jgi:acylphosphatase